MPGQTETDGLAALTQQGENASNTDGSNQRQDRNCSILSIEKCFCSLENGVRDFLHRRSSGVFAQNREREVCSKKNCQETYTDRDPDVAAHGEMPPYKRKENPANIRGNRPQYHIIEVFSPSQETDRRRSLPGWLHGGSEMYLRHERSLSGYMAKHLQGKTGDMLFPYLSR